MFAVIYQGYVVEGREGEYQKAWNRVAQYFIKHRGAIGSCLHRTAEGLWVAYSRWPDRKTRDASWPPSEELPDEIQESIATLKNCLDQKKQLPDLCMEVVDDLFFK